VATNTPIREYAACVDTVSLCLSKTLGAPVGSVLVGPQSVIDRVCIV
jgi:threonine aldolase